MGTALASKPSVADVYITSELDKRAPKRIDYLREKRAIQELAARMVDQPEGVLPRFVDLAMEMTGGVSGGLSLFEERPTPGVFRWRYLRGILSPFENATTPRDFSPCGITLDQNAGPVLSQHPERVYDWIANADIVVPEVLLVPLYLGGEDALGTLWIVSNKKGHFDSGHARALTELASFVGIALRMLRTEESLQRAIAERDLHIQKAEEALRQAQKMETVGHLTSGIAHDFNNLLTIVMGSLESVERRFAAADARVTKAVATAIRGAERAAILSHRLLAFSRPRGVEPETLDLNDVIAGMLDLLKRTLGEQISITIVVTDQVWPVRVDENQLENAILNLAINARDAMPDGGALTITATNAIVDDSLVEREIELKLGEYVLLSVTDTGSGMAPEIVQRIFEPFFTTKGVEGTGLGLGMVYGFVKQAQGHVQVQSEMGKGTSVNLYFPRVDEDQIVGIKTIHRDDALRSGREIILVAEDDHGVREFIVEILKDLGYGTLAAADAKSALLALKEHPKISLLLTDLGLPDMSGPSLVAESLRLRPDLHVLFMTGYDAETAIRNNILDPSANLIEKPFTFATLGEKIGSILEPT